MLYLTNIYNLIILCVLSIPLKSTTG